MDEFTCSHTYFLRAEQKSAEGDNWRRAVNGDFRVLLQPRMTFVAQFKAKTTANDFLTFANILLLLRMFPYVLLTQIAAMSHPHK
jgi:hypothetical protein